MNDIYLNTTIVNITYAMFRSFVICEFYFSNRKKNWCCNLRFILSNGKSFTL